MRVLIDIPDDRLKKLGRICEVKKVSRAAAVREAIDEYLVRSEKVTIEAARGLWGDRKVDGLKYQKKLRAEW